MAITVEQVKSVLERALPGVVVEVEGANLIVTSTDLVRVCQALKASPELAMDHVTNLAAVDYLPDAAANSAGRIDVVYHLGSMEKKLGPVGVVVRLPRATPRVPSLVPVYRGAEYQEREAFDLYGVVFDGHPDLRRILMWDGFQGHPMRKDYVVEDQDAFDGAPR